MTGAGPPARSPSPGEPPAVSVVLPTYNERDGIAELVEEILAVGRAAGLALEVVVVDDDSPDGTAEHLRHVLGADPAVRVCVRRGERGLASAIRYGLGEARGRTLVVMDSDGNHDPAQVPLINELFTPTAEEIGLAQELVQLFAHNPGAGVLAHRGQMVDRAHLVRAERILARATSAGRSATPD